MSGAVVTRLRVLGVVAHGVALPDFNVRSADDAATVPHVHDGDRQRERQPALAFGDVLPEVGRVVDHPDPVGIGACRFLGSDGATRGAWSRGRRAAARSGRRRWAHGRRSATHRESHGCQT